ncbi:MAG: DUF1858 domain-containing protein [Lachnospiraceae bacterium]|nr:DUF1858 domain-containing protein [Lachnospiraceae bacterium]
MIITKYSLIGAILQCYPESKECFQNMGMQCVSCPSSGRETLEQACREHSQDVDVLVDSLNRFVNG